MTKRATTWLHPRYGFIKRIKYKDFMAKHKECGKHTNIHLVWRDYCKHQNVVCPECNEL